MVYLGFSTTSTFMETNHVIRRHGLYSLCYGMRLTSNAKDYNPIRMSQAEVEPSNTSLSKQNRTPPPPPSPPPNSHTTIKSWPEWMLPNMQVHRWGSLFRDPSILCVVLYPRRPCEAALKHKYLAKMHRRKWLKSQMKIHWSSLLLPFIRECQKAWLWEPFEEDMAVLTNVLMFVILRGQLSLWFFWQYCVCFL